MIHSSSIDLFGKTLSIETGKLALQASGSVVVRIGDTVVLATCMGSEKIREGIDYFPLMVDYEEKMYAVGKIPGGFFKREGRPTEKAILTSRLIDRPIRPMFPDGFRNDVQIVVTPLSVDENHPPDILAIIGASTALAISDVPFLGPIGAARIGRLDGKFIINPTNQEMEKSDLDIVIAGTKGKVLMIEAKGSEIPEDVMIEAIALGQSAIDKVIDMQIEFAKKVGVPKMKYTPYFPDEKLTDFIKKGYTNDIKAALDITDKEKQQDKLAIISDEAVKKIEESNDGHLKQIVEKKSSELKEIIKSIEKNIVRDMIIKSDRRPDGRKMDEIREITCEVSALPRAHGSAVFTRGMTQALTVVTLGSKSDAQRIDGLDAEEGEKRYMHHYNMPAYSVGEIKPLRGPGRREIGHGALAEKALIHVIPDEDTFPYTIRLVSEILGSNGSSSMASTCGSTLALMDAGVPIKSPVSGIAMGLVEEGDSFKVLSDLQGLEDFLGDMDFKIAGTKKGITAIQLDVKNKGLSGEIIKKTFSQAKTGRDFILAKMLSAIAAPRSDLSNFAPRMLSFSINPEKIGMVIGPGGKNIKAIIEETGAQIDIEDSGRVFISSIDPKAAEEARARVEAIAVDVEAGSIYKGRVVKIMPFGAFVEIAPGKDGLVHISKLSDKRVASVEEVVSVGDEVTVKVSEIDSMGRINLTMRI